jgi:hypothetical protein
MAKILVLGNGPQDRPEWESYYERLGNRRCIYAHPSYIALLSALYGDPAELFLYQEGNSFVYYPYFKRQLLHCGLRVPDGIELSGRVDFHSSWYYGGPLSSALDVSLDFAARFVEAFRHHAERCRCVSEFVRLDPNIRNDVFYPTEQPSFNRETVYIDLANRTREAIWEDFKPSNRRAINRARREGVVAVPRGTQDVDTWTQFAGIYADEMVRKNAPAHLRFKEAFFHQLRAALPNNLCLMTAVKGDEFCGAHLIIFDETTAYLFLSATAFSHWPLRVNNLLWAEAIFWAKDQGRSRYDLQGGRPGVFRFKTLFARTRGKFYTLNAVHDRSVFEALVACNTQSGADDRSQRFPPYLDSSCGQPAHPTKCFGDAEA